MIKQTAIIFVTFISLIYTNTCGALSYHPLISQIEYHSENLNQQVSLGLYIRHAEHGEVIYQKNASRYFVPSSVTKILTAAASLKTLSNVPFQTQILASNLPKNGRLNNDLFIKFSGDPTLTINDLEQLIKNLRLQHNLSQVNGNIVIDESIFNSKSYGPGWMIEDAGYYYSPPINGISLNENSFTVIFKPINSRVTVAFDKTLPVKIINNITLHDTQTRIQLTYNQENLYTASGTLSKTAEQHKIRFSIVNTEKFSLDIIKDFLSKYRIEYTGKIVFKETPCKCKNLKILSSHDAPGLGVIIKKMMHNSDNLIADTLLKTLGMHMNSSQGTWKNGSIALQRIIHDHFNLPASTYITKDGSGLTRYNLITPKQIGDVLYEIYHSDIKQSFIETLPQAGIDGKQLKNRMPNLLRTIRAKTGNMTGHSAIAGFVDTIYGKLIVVIFISHFIDSTKAYQAWQDSLLTDLTQITSA